MCDLGLILWGEIRCLSLLGVEKLQTQQISSWVLFVKSLDEFYIVWRSFFRLALAKVILSYFRFQSIYIFII